MVLRLRSAGDGVLPSFYRPINSLLLHSTQRGTDTTSSNFSIWVQSKKFLKSKNLKILMDYTLHKFRYLREYFWMCKNCQLYHNNVVQNMEIPNLLEFEVNPQVGKKIFELKSENYFCSSLACSLQFPIKINFRQQVSCYRSIKVFLRKKWFKSNARTLMLMLIWSTNWRWTNISGISSSALDLNHFLSNKTDLIHTWQKNKVICSCLWMNKNDLKMPLILTILTTLPSEKMGQSMWQSCEWSHIKSTSCSLGAIGGVHCTFSIHSAYLLKNQS